LKDSKARAAQRGIHREQDFIGIHSTKNQKLRKVITPAAGRNSSGFSPFLR
jgi:hypothetical protein